MTGYYCSETECKDEAPHRYHCGKCAAPMDGQYSHYHGTHMDPKSFKFVPVEHHFKCDPGACEDAHARRVVTPKKKKVKK